MEIDTPQIPGYRIEREIGRGGMAIVYLAEQEPVGRRVALKLLSPALTIDKQFSNRFVKEKSIVAQLNHPNIVAVYDAGAYENFYYFAMEFLSGGTLEEKLKAGALPLNEALQICKEIGRALSFAHSLNLIHRDIKPGNILFRHDNTPVLTDFGVAKSLDDTNTELTAPGMIVGSPHYMSPEQILGHPVDSRSDIYSLGILLYQMLTGQRPYDADNLVALATRHINDPIPDLPGQFAQYNPVVKKALAKNADERFDSMESFVQALEQVAASETALSTTLPQKALPKGQTGKRLLLLTVISLILASVLGLSSYFSLHISSDNGSQQQLAEILQQAEQAQQRGEFEESLGLIHQGLQIIPDDPQLLALRDNVQMQLAAELQQQEQLKDFLTKAQIAFDDGDLDESMQLIRQGLSLVSDYPGLQALKDAVQMRIDERIAQQQGLDKINELIRQVRQTDALDEQLSLIDEGMCLMPDDPELQTVLASVLRAKLESYTVQKKIKEILTKANEVLQNGKYYVGLSLIKTGLQLDPDNPQLLALQKTVSAEKITTGCMQQRVDELLTRARQAEQAGHLEQSLRLVNAGLEFSTDHDEALKALKLRLEKRLAERSAEQRHQQRLQQYLIEAKQAQQNGQIEKSLVLIEEGLRFDNDFQPLIVLRDQVNYQQHQLRANKWPVTSTAFFLLMIGTLTIAIWLLVKSKSGQVVAVAGMDEVRRQTHALGDKSTKSAPTNATIIAPIDPNIAAHVPPAPQGLPIGSIDATGIVHAPGQFGDELPVALMVNACRDTEFLGKRIDIDRFPFIIGRSAQANLSFPSDSHLSRKHCQIDQLDNGFCIVDLSVNGLFVNGRQVPVNNKAPLLFNDSIMLSQNTSLTFVADVEVLPDLTGLMLDDRYELKECLYSSIKASTFLAEDKQYTRFLTIKVFTPSIMRISHYAEALRQQAEIAVKLTHPYIAKVLENKVAKIVINDMEQHLPYLCMERMLGGNLEDKLAADSPPTLTDIIDWLLKLAQALTYVHDKKIIHGSLKPSAVVFDDNDNPYLSDFALASFEGSTTGSALLGAPAFIAPEQWNHEPLSSAVDQYSLAVLTYLMITGSHPFEGQSDPEVRRRNFLRPPLPAHEEATRNGISGVPETISAVINKGLSVHPSNRYESVQAFIDALTNAAAGLNVDEKRRAFISYHRGTSAAWATLFDRVLREQYDIEVYVDTQNLDRATRFPDRLKNAVINCDVVVCLLSSETLTSKWVQEEIRIAYEHDKPMVPVFQESFDRQIDEEALEPHLRAMLAFDGVRLFDQQNVYIDTAIADLARIVHSTLPQ